MYPDHIFLDPLINKNLKSLSSFIREDYFIKEVNSIGTMPWKTIGKTKRKSLRVAGQNMNWDHPSEADPKRYVEGEGSKIINLENQKLNEITKVMYHGK